MKKRPIDILVSCMRMLIPISGMNTEILKSYLTEPEWDEAVRQLYIDGGRFVDRAFYWYEPARQWAHKLATVKYGNLIIH